MVAASICGSDIDIEKFEATPRERRKSFYCHLPPGERRLTSPRQPLADAHATRIAPGGGGRATSLASGQRFWAIAASVNSSCAPLQRKGPPARPPTAGFAEGDQQPEPAELRGHRGLL